MSAFSGLNQRRRRSEAPSENVTASKPSGLPPRPPTKRGFEAFQTGNRNNQTMGGRSMAPWSKPDPRFRSRATPRPKGPIIPSKSDFPSLGGKKKSITPTEASKKATSVSTVWANKDVVENIKDPKNGEIWQKKLKEYEHMKREVFNQIAYSKMGKMYDNQYNSDKFFYEDEEPDEDSYESIDHDEYYELY